MDIAGPRLAAPFNQPGFRDLIDFTHEHVVAATKHQVQGARRGQANNVKLGEPNSRPSYPLQAFAPTIK